jgi:hypothetical protein
MVVVSHDVVVPSEKESLALCFGRAHTQYTRMINFRNEWRGFLWQGRFGSSPMDEPYTYHTVRYLLRNPVRACIVRMPWRYEWSSAAFHVGEKKTDPLVKPKGELDDMIGDWREYLLEPGADNVLCQVRRETSVGRPLGSPEFVEKIGECPRKTGGGTRPPSNAPNAGEAEKEPNKSVSVPGKPNKSVSVPGKPTRRPAGRPKRTQ